MDLYQTRLREMNDTYGPYSEIEAAKDFHRFLIGESISHVRELNYYDRRQIHNLKYFTWIEQQGKDVNKLDAQWYDFPEYWDRMHQQINQIDELIEQFNERTGLLV